MISRKDMQRIEGMERDIDLLRGLGYLEGKGKDTSETLTLLVRRIEKLERRVQVLERPKIPLKKKDE